MGTEPAARATPASGRPDASVDRGGIWTDTREMAWAPVGADGERVKVLHRDPTGQALVSLVWTPPGATLSPEHERPAGREHAFTIAGDMPLREHAGAADAGQTVAYLQGFYADRRPGSLHGPVDDATSMAGTVRLVWSHHVGSDRAAGAPPAPRGPSRAGVVLERPELTVLDTRAMAWEDYDGLAGTKIKVLARDDAGEPSVSLVLLLAGDRPGRERPHRHYHRTVHEFSYVLDGDVPIWEYADADQRDGELVVARQGYFMNRPPGTLHGIEAGTTSPTGGVILEWRTGPGTYVDEPGAATETVTVPYPR